MLFAPSHEQEQIKAAARSFFERENPLSHAVLAAESSEDTRLSWNRLADELGATALAVPASDGGIGGSFVEFAVVLEEAGRAVSSLPLSSSAVATGVLLQSHGFATRDDLIESAAAGRTVTSVALPELPRIANARREDTGWVISGGWRSVPHALEADALLVFANTSEGWGCFRVVPGRSVERKAQPALDPTQRLASVVLHEAPATLIGDLAQGNELLEHAQHVARIALALDAVGGARMCLELALDHARVREQFGRPIGSFQAIKHKCADMLLWVEAATSAAHAAAWQLATSPGDEFQLMTASTVAKSYCSEAYLRVSADLIQILGGIGFTWEHPAHLFFKRARYNSSQWGDPSAIRVLQRQLLNLNNQRDS